MIFRRSFVGPELPGYLAAELRDDCVHRGAIQTHPLALGHAPSCQAEVRRLAEAGILTVRAVGRSRLVRANTSSKIVGPLTELMTLTFGLHIVIADEFADVAGAEMVLIYGSWAARYHGDRDRPPNDVDVLVVGTPDRIAMHTAAERAENRLGIQVNPVVCSPERWASASDPLVREVQARPYVTITERDTFGESE